MCTGTRRALAYLLTGPTDGLTDDFLRDVARACAAAVGRGERPNVAISKQVGYPLKTVQRWVFTARQRGIMPPAPRGAPADEHHVHRLQIAPRT
jgi:hypothetical protein